MRADGDDAVQCSRATRRGHSDELLQVSGYTLYQRTGVGRWGGGLVVGGDNDGMERCG